MILNLPEEIQMLKDTIRRFVDNEVAPYSEQIDQEEKIPKDLVQKVKELGLFGLTTPVEYGGSGIGPLGYAVVREEVARVNMGFGSLFLVNNGIGGKGIQLEGTEEQKQKYLPGIASGDLYACFALTEPEAGSDAGALKTTADLNGDHYVLNGRKMFITNGPNADLITVMAVTDKIKRMRGGITAFIVEKGTPGLTQGKPEKKMGWHGSPTSDLLFEDCSVPLKNVLGKVGYGFNIAMKTLAFGRLGVAATALGAAQKAFEMSCQYAKERMTFGKTIGSYQFIQEMIARMAVEIHASRLMVYNTAILMEAGKKCDVEASMAKLYASEVAGRATDMNVQIHGGMGYTEELGAERLFRDARLLRIVEGTSEIQKIVISRSFLGK